jgi:hypothetical protein
MKTDTSGLDKVQCEMVSNRSAFYIKLTINPSDISHKNVKEYTAKVYALFIGYLHKYYIRDSDWSYEDEWLSYMHSSKSSTPVHATIQVLPISNEAKLYCGLIK